MLRSPASFSFAHLGHDDEDARGGGGDADRRARSQSLLHDGVGKGAVGVHSRHAAALVNWVLLTYALALPACLRFGLIPLSPVSELNHHFVCAFRVSLGTLPHCRRACLCCTA